MVDPRLTLLVGADVVDEWNVHKKDWINCTRCDLCHRRTRVVLARGQIPADIVVIGEGPGTGEDATGLPFVGRSGRLLDEWIEEGWKRVGGLFRPTMAITNAVACAPYNDQRKIVAPDSDAMAACYPRVLEFLKIAQPVAVVLVGKVAQSLVGDEFNGLGHQTFKCYHPSYTLQSDGKGNYEGIHAFAEAYSYAAATTTRKASVGPLARRSNLKLPKPIRPVQKAD